MQTVAMSSSRADSCADNTASEWLIRPQNDWHKSNISPRQCDTWPLHNTHLPINTGSHSPAFIKLQTFPGISHRRSDIYYTTRGIQTGQSVLLSEYCGTIGSPSCACQLYLTVHGSCSFCHYRNCVTTGKPQFSWLFPDQCQIPWIFQVFQVGGHCKTATLTKSICFRPQWSTSVVNRGHKDDRIYTREFKNLTANIIIVRSTWHTEVSKDPIPFEPLHHMIKY